MLVIWPPLRNTSVIKSCYTTTSSSLTVGTPPRQVVLPHCCYVAHHPQTTAGSVAMSAEFMTKLWLPHIVQKKVYIV